MKTITIGVVDDHPAISEGIKSAFGKFPQMKVCFVSADVTVLDELIKEYKPDVLILDLILPGVTSTQLFSTLLTKFPGLNIVAHTSLNAPPTINLLYAQGIKAYINKQEPFAELFAAVTCAAEGITYVPESLSGVYKPMGKTAQQLTDREISVLRLIAAGLSSKEIAEKLFISENTVEAHRKNLFLKMGVKNLAGLIREGFALAYLH